MWGGGRNQQQRVRVCGVILNDVCAHVPKSPMYSIGHIRLAHIAWGQNIGA
jgi:hypothetical protein